MYTVIMKSCGNPDYGQFAPLSPPRIERVAGIDEARAACRRYIEEFNLGGGNWSGGEVLDARNRLVGTVSYNGRFWPVAEQTMPKRPDPAVERRCRRTLAWHDRTHRTSGRANKSGK